MKVVIDITKELYDRVVNCKVQNGSIASKIVMNAVKNGVVIQDGI